MNAVKIFSELSMLRLVIVAIFATSGYFFLYYDNGETIEKQIVEVDGQLNAEKAKRVEIEKKMKKEEEMRGNLLQLARNLDLVKSKIPNEFNEIEVSSILNRASALSQVKIVNLKRSNQNDQNAAANAEKKVGAELVEEVVFNIEMLGTFNSIIQFVELLSKEEKTIKIRNFILEKESPFFTEANLIKFRGEIVGFKQATLVKAASPSEPKVRQ